MSAPGPAVDTLRRAAALVASDEFAVRMALALDGLRPALAAWLEAEAKQEAYTLAEFGHRSAKAEALAVARAVLGEEADR